MENNKFKDFLEKVLYPMKIREDKEYIGTGYYKGIQETLDKIIDILKKVMKIMSNEWKLFEHEKFGKLEIYIDKQGREWFPATELAKKNPQEAIRKHCKEAGCVFYSVQLSKWNKAEEFESWIFDEILPTIRKTGMYITDNLWTQLSNDPTKFGELLIDYGKTKDELKETKAKNDILMHTEKTYTVTELAKELGVSSARILNKILFKDHIQYYMNGTWVLYSSLQQDNLIIINLSYYPETNFKTFLVQIQLLGCLFQKNSSMTTTKISKGSQKKNPGLNFQPIY